MKIAFVLTQSLDGPGGLGRFGPLARELARLGHDLEVYALHPAFGALSRRRFTENGIKVQYVGQMHVRKGGSGKQYYGPARLMGVSLAATMKLAAALARSEAEVIQVCKAQPINLLAARLAARGRPIFVDCDDYEALMNVFSGGWQRVIVRRFEDGVVGYAAGLTSNTTFTTRRYEALGYPAERIVYVPNGVERSRFSSRPDVSELRASLGLAADDPVVTYIGNLGITTHPVNLLLEAFARLAETSPTTRLLLVGGGPDYDRLRDQAKELGIAKRSVFTGRVPAEEIPKYLALSTVTVDPVQDDLVAQARSPLKVVESLVMGVPVVTGDVGDRPLILEDGRLGVLVEPGSSQALAQGLIALLRDDGRRSAMAQAALERRESYYWDRLVRDFQRVYDLA